MSAVPYGERAIHRPDAERMGFFTDTTVCIGCKACEVACKQWNDLPADGAEFRRGGSYDHTGQLSANTWRHVAFVEMITPSPDEQADARAALERGVGGGMPNLPVTSGDLDLVGAAARGGDGDGAVDVEQAVADMSRWVFMSDVCKHCTNAGCLDACPTGALVRTEFDTVVLQPDVCNGCGYCVPACPFGVVARDEEDGRAGKCTLCYDRLKDGMEPACAKSCPTDSIQFGPYDELVQTAQGRVTELHARGQTDAYLYGAGDEPDEELAGGLGAFFLFREAPERYGMPANADSPIQENVPAATAAGLAAAAAALTGVTLSLVATHRRRPRRRRG
jgi:formate dehydrogenase iron-sulfur subunit